ncbi:8-oxo-dGTP diphosphatase [Candidatus Woesearchaeota archaeon]|nr:8-oxo-dGTP diphosphatase [Candidatus Woesearchaeota archaeon]
MKQATLCIIREENKILLGLKKRGFGEGKYNGFGGKVMNGESIIDAAIRELQEESGLIGMRLENVGELSFHFPHKSDWNQIVYLFVVHEYSGRLEESEEMKPVWFSLNNIPFEKMWDDDQYWLPAILEGKKIQGKFTFKEDNKTIEYYELRQII